MKESGVRNWVKKRRHWISVSIAATLLVGAGLSVSWAQVGPGACPLPRKTVKNARCAMAHISTSTTRLLKCFPLTDSGRCEADFTAQNPCRGTFWTGAVNGICKPDDAPGSSSESSTCIENVMMRPIQIYKYIPTCSSKIWGFETGECRCMPVFVDPPVSMLVAACDCAN